MCVAGEGLRVCVEMRRRVAEADYEVCGSSASPATFAARKSRLNRLQQVCVAGSSPWSVQLNEYKLLLPDSF